MSKHTEGPWERVDTADYAEIHPKGQRQKSAIALVASPGDADLITAAPDLLEALKLAVEEIEDLRRFANNNGGMIDDEDFSEGRAAIAKAEGRPHG